MTPQEKAKELVNSFYQPLEKLHCKVSNYEIWNHAKQCAIILCDEIIESHETHFPMGTVELSYMGDFYNEVKTNINSL